MITASEFVKWLQVFGIKSGGGGSGTVDDGTADQLAYYEIDGTVVSGLTLGTNLSITDGVLNAASGGSGTVDSGSENQLAYYETDGTVVSGLTLGTNLSITDGVLNATGGSGVTAAQVQSSEFNFTGTDTGTADNYVISLSPAPSSLTDGMIVSFIPAHNNATTNPVISVNSFTNIPIVLINAGVNNNDITEDFPCNLQYSAILSSFILLNPITQYPFGYEFLSGAPFQLTDNGSSIINAYVGRSDYAPNLDLGYGTFIYLVPLGLTNTGPSTFNLINGPGLACEIHLPNGNLLAGGELVGGQTYILRQQYQSPNPIFILDDSATTVFASGIAANKILVTNGSGLSIWSSVGTGLALSEGILSATASGTVDSGSENQFAFYAADGTVVQGIDGTQGLQILEGVIILGENENIQFNTGNGLQDSNGNLILSVSATSEAVNYITIINAQSTDSPIIESQGTDTNIGLVIACQGTENITLASMGGMENLAIFQGNPAAVNYINFSNSITGSGPFIAATGSDTNVSLSLFSKGTGNFGFLCEEGTTICLLLDAVASAVNYINITPSVTGESPSLVATGTDTNIGLLFSSTGLGSIGLCADSLSYPIAFFETQVTPINYFVFKNSEENMALTIEAAGEDDNITLQLVGKNVGPVQLVSNGNIVLEALSLSSSDVNYIGFASSVTTLAPIMTAFGSDENINIALSPQGLGKIQFATAGSFSTNGTVATVLGSLGPTGASTTVQKWLTIIDNDGTTQYIPCF